MSDKEPPYPYDSHFDELLDKLKREGRYRVFANLEREVGSFPVVKQHTESGERPVTVWCSNDYLGMGHNPSVLRAMHEALDSFGAGSGGTRNISGTHTEIVHLERELADLHDKEAALVFTSGYIANSTALSTLARFLPDCVVFSDSENHASMIQGIRGSKAEKYIYEHNDLGHLEKLLADVDPARPKIIAFESVYSMSGDFSPIKEICDLADRFDALTFLDETHGVGLYGHKGGGVAQARGLTDRVDVIQGGLGKGFGVVGGFITASARIVDVVRSYGTGFIFTTSLPPVVAAGAVASIQHLKQSQVERDRHQANVRMLRSKMREAALPILETPSHIIPLMVRNSSTCKAVSDYLLQEEATYIQPINYPTVPAGTERLRITPGPLHTEEQMDFLVAALCRAWQKFGLPLQSRVDSVKDAAVPNEFTLTA